MTLTDFLTTLVREKHVDASLEALQVTEMVRDLTQRLTKFIILNVLTELATKNQALLAKFQTLAKGTTSPEAIQTFVEAEIPDGSAFLAKILTDFRALYMGNTP